MTWLGVFIPPSDVPASRRRFERPTSRFERHTIGLPYRCLALIVAVISATRSSTRSSPNPASSVVCSSRSPHSTNRTSTWGRVAPGFALSELVAVGTEILAYRNRGTFGLDWEQYRFFVELPSPAGYLVKLSYQYNSLNETDFDFDDYSAHMVTASVGYRF